MNEPLQLDLTEHVFRSVRGWLHRLFPDDLILIERRKDESLRESDDGATTPDRPIWNLVLATGPNWAEHTGGSSMVTYTIKIIRAADSLWDAQRMAGTVVANASRPGGRIPLRGYNLTWPAQPNVRVGNDMATDLPELVDIALVATKDGDAVSAPSQPVTAKPVAGKPLLLTTNSWPYGRPSGLIYAAPSGEALQLQGEIGPNDIFVLSELADGSTPATNVSCDLPGLRVTSATADTSQLSTDDADPHQAVIQLGLSVQVPRVLGAHLDAALVP